MSEFSEVRVITPPAAGVLTVAQVDAHVRVADLSAETAYLEQILAAATKAAEARTQRSLAPRTLALDLETFPAGDQRIWLPYPPIISVTSVVYVNTDGNQVTLDPSAYVLRSTGKDTNRKGLLEPAYQTLWPSTRTHLGAVVVTYQAGYEDDGASPAGYDVPEHILQGILQVVGELYKQRSESVHSLNQNPAVIRAHQLWDLSRVR